MTARDVCLSPAEWENALVQLQLAKQLGLIDDASPEATVKTGFRLVIGSWKIIEI